MNTIYSEYGCFVIREYNETAYTCVQLNQLSILLMYLDEEECYKVILPVVYCAGYKVMYMSGLLGKV